MPGNRRITGFFRPFSPTQAPTNISVTAENESPEVSVHWDTRLPSRIFATDRYPDARLNVYSKPDTLSFICYALRGTPELQTILDSCFGPLFSLPVNRCPTSCKLIHALLCRQLVTKRKYELWTVFGGQPLRFSLAEFGAISGLPCDPFADDYDPEDEITPKQDDVYYWDKLIGDRKATLGDVGKMLTDCRKRNGPEDGPRALRLALILIVDGVLIASHQIGRPTLKYVEMLENLDEFLSFPWGRESFLKTIVPMRPNYCSNQIGLKKTVKGNPLQLFTQQLQQQLIRLTGFPLALQLLAFNSIS